MKSADECEVSTRAALLALIDDMQPQSHEDMAKVMMMVITTAFGTIAETAGLEVAIQITEGVLHSGQMHQAMQRGQVQ